MDKERKWFLQGDKPKLSNGGKSVKKWAQWRDFETLG